MGTVWVPELSTLLRRYNESEWFLRGPPLARDSRRFGSLVFMLLSMYMEKVYR